MRKDVMKQTCESVSEAFEMWKFGMGIGILALLGFASLHFLGIPTTVCIVFILLILYCLIFWGMI
jgi:hypothetical protein